MIRGLVEVRGIGTDFGLAVRIVVTIGHIETGVDFIAGKQTGDGVFISIRIRHGLGLAIIGMGGAVGRNGERDLVEDSDDVAGIILNDLHRAALGNESADLRVGIFGVEIRRLGGVNHSADPDLGGLVFRYLCRSALEVVVDGILRLVQLEVDLQGLL